MRLQKKVNNKSIRLSKTERVWWFMHMLQVVGAGGLLQVPGESSLYGECQPGQGYVDKFVSKRQTRNK